MAAASKDYIEVVSWFLEAGADVNAKNNKGETALTYARNPRVISILEQYGAK